MAFYVVQGNWSGTGETPVMDATGTTAYTLTSGANGTQLTGTGNLLVIYPDADGWLHVSKTSATDKAAALKSHRITSGVPYYPLGGVGKGQWISFLAG